MTSIHSVLSCLSERRQNSASLEEALFMYSSNSTYGQIMYVHCTEHGSYVQYFMYSMYRLL